MRHGGVGVARRIVHSAAWAGSQPDWSSLHAKVRSADLGGGY